MTSSSRPIHQKPEMSSRSPTIKRRGITENCAIVWLDAAFSNSNDINKNKLEQFGRFAGQIHTFVEPNECIDFITDVYDAKLFCISRALLANRLFQSSMICHM